MSQENVEIVRGIYDATARRDNKAPFEVFAEDIVWDLSRSARGAMIGEPVAQGHAGVRQAWTDLVSALGDLAFDLEVIDAGERVLAVVRERWVGRASGVPVEAAHLAVWTLADGKVTQMQLFDDRREALEAAGLRE